MLRIHLTPLKDLHPSEIHSYLHDSPQNILIDSLSELCMENEGVFQYLDTFAANDATKKRVFVRGLDYKTTKESLKAAFERFGEITDSTIIFNRATSRSKGSLFPLSFPPQTCQKSAIFLVFSKLS